VAKPYRPHQPKKKVPKKKKKEWAPPMNLLMSFLRHRHQDRGIIEISMKLITFILH
jgi:hypothetical protein